MFLLSKKLQRGLFTLKESLSYRCVIREPLSFQHKGLSSALIFTLTRLDLSELRSGKSTAFVP